MHPYKAHPFQTCRGTRLPPLPLDQAHYLAMDCLPDELISYIFDFLHPGGTLSSAMLVNQQWYMYGARNLHHNVVFCLGPGLTINSSDVAISFMKRLVSSPLSTAHRVHHLTLSGFASLDIQELILDILGRTHNLRSLNMQSLHILQGGMRFSQELFSSPSSLPNLVALNTSSATFGVSLVQTRQYVEALRVHEPMDDACLRRLLSPGPGDGGDDNPSPAHKIKLLELALSVDSTAAAVARVAFLASTLAGGALRALALQFDFDVDRPRPVSWDEFEVRLPLNGCLARSGGPGGQRRRIRHRALRASRAGGAARFRQGRRVSYSFIDSRRLCFF